MTPGEESHLSLIRKLLGSELVIVMLTMPEDQIKRRLQRRHFHKEDAKLVDILMVIHDSDNFEFKMLLQRIGNSIEKIEADEENVVTVEVKEGMTEEEIMELVLQRVEGDLPLKEDLSGNLDNND